jgi:sarcosine oxidase gamma subunit
VTALRVVTVLAAETGCERIAELPGASRISPTEVMILGEVSIEVLERAVRADDPGAVVAEVTDGWALVRLEGPRAREAFARLSELELPAFGFVQGEVARIGVRVLAEGDRIDLLVPAMVEAHVRERVQIDCEGLLP